MAEKGQKENESQLGEFFEEAKDVLEYSERTLNSFARVKAINRLQSAKTNFKNVWTKMGNSAWAFASKSEIEILGKKQEEITSLFDQHNILKSPFKNDLKLLKSGTNEEIEGLYEKYNNLSRTLEQDEKLLRSGKTQDTKKLLNKYLTAPSKKRRKVFESVTIPVSQKKRAIRAMIDKSFDNLDGYFTPKIKSLGRVKVLDETVENFSNDKRLIKAFKSISSNEGLVRVLKHLGFFNDFIGIFDAIDEVGNLGKEKNPWFKMASVVKILKNTSDFGKAVKVILKSPKKVENIFLKNLPKMGRFASKLGRFARFAGPVGEVISFGLDVTDALKETDAKKKQIKVGAAIGGAAGAIAAGALVGSILPGAGTLVGAAVGMAGYYAGRYIGEYLGNPENRKKLLNIGKKAWNWFTNPKVLTTIHNVIAGGVVINNPLFAAGALMYGINTLIPLPKKANSSSKQKMKQIPNIRFNPYVDSLKLLNLKPTTQHLTPAPRPKVTPTATPSPLTSNGFSLNHDEIFGVMVRGMNKVIQNTA